MKATDLKPADAEQWMRKLLEMVVLRRGTMYRFIAESVRTLILANAGAVAMVVGFFRAPGGEGPFHWVTLLTMALFIAGALSAAVTLILITGVTVKEAHGMETALHEFAKGKLTRDEVMFYLESETTRLANTASGFGVVSGSFFVLGCLAGLIQLAIFF